MIKLWNAGKISASEVWTFAYDDDNKKHYPVACRKRYYLPKTYETDLAEKIQHNYRNIRI